MVGSWGMGWGGFGEVGGCPTNDSRYPPYSRSSAVTANGGDDANGWFVGGWVGVGDAQIDGRPTSDSRYPCIRGHRLLPRMGRMTRMIGSLGMGRGGFGKVGGCPTSYSRYPPHSRSSVVTANGKMARMVGSPSFQHFIAWPGRFAAFPVQNTAEGVHISTAGALVEKAGCLKTSGCFLSFNFFRCHLLTSNRMYRSLRSNHTPFRHSPKERVQSTVEVPNGIHRPYRCRRTSAG